MMNETLGKVHFVITFIASNWTFFPMHIVGAAGLPRRYAAYAVDASATKQWAHLQPYNEFMTYGALVLGAAQVLLYANLLWSLFKGKKAGDNPWKANTLEWTLASPPGHHNYPVIPTVYRGPYEYSSPLVEEDYLPQSLALDPEAAARERRLQSEGH
jgi:cytochrome c oxidase subunit 1